MIAPWLPRRAADVAVAALGDFRVLVVHGARQVGKSTLAAHLAERIGAAVVSLDDEDARRAAQNDPATFLQAMGTPLVIDEIQRVGEPLVLAVKAAVDRDRRRGQFVLTGSTNFLTVPTISESLAGRAAFLTLWPLAQGELHDGADAFLDRAFGGPAELLAHEGASIERDEYLERLCLGGYPELLSITERGRRRWFDSYVSTVLAREIEMAGDIRRSDALAGMVRYFAAITASELVLTSAAERLGIARATAAEYLPWLQTVFLVHHVPAWSRNLTAKVVKRPKIHMVDTGVAANLLGRRPEALRHPTEPATGPLFESFVVNEIAKQLTWSGTAARLFHFRDRDGTEVDAVLEADDGRVVAVETKATSTPRPEDFRGLAKLRDAVDRAGGQFVGGVLLHTGPRRLPFGERLVALPAADLWT
ncbi:MAG: ATP-binding protein [Sporichthyaceae bacterium]